MGAVALASAYLYIFCKTKCIDMKATLCATCCGVSAVFGLEGWVGGSECGASELWEWEPPSDPSRTCGFDRRPEAQRPPFSYAHPLNFNLCPLFELASDKSRLPEEDSGWTVREAKLSMNSLSSML